MTENVHCTVKKLEFYFGSQCRIGECRHIWMENLWYCKFYNIPENLGWLYEIKDQLLSFSWPPVEVSLHNTLNPCNSCPMESSPRELIKLITIIIIEKLKLVYIAFLWSSVISIMLTELSVSDRVHASIYLI